MTDKNKEKVATLTGSLLARKGTATPAGFTRVAPSERETLDPPSMPPNKIAAREETDSDQPSLDLGPAYASKSGSAEEGWAPLSQIVIRPHPFQSEASEPVLVAEPTVPMAPPRDAGIEPTLSMDPARSLAVTPVPGEGDKDAPVESQSEPPASYPSEPILVVPLALRKARTGKWDAHIALDDAHDDALEEPRAPKLDRAGGDSSIPGAEPTLFAGGDNDSGAEHPDKSEESAGESILAAVSSSMDGPDSPPTKEPRVTEPPVTESAAAASRVRDRRVDGGGSAGATRIKPPSAKSPEAKHVAARPIRIGELQARARVISGRSRRRGRLAPVIWAVVALAVFLGVTWQVYRINRDAGSGFVSATGANGEPTIWATVDELGYAVSQIVSALTGGIGAEGGDDATLAAGANDVIVPTPKFVPVGPIGAEPDGSRSTAGDVAAAPIEAPGSQTGEAVAEVTPTKPLELPPPPVEIARESAPAADPLPAPRVPAAPVVADSEDNVATATPRPAGVTAPPAPPLSVDLAGPADAAAPDAIAPQPREEVDTAISLEPLAPATIAVAAGGEGGASAGGGVDTSSVTEVASLPPSSAGPPATTGTRGAGVPVLKPVARLTQQALGGVPAAAGASGPSDAAPADSGGYAVQLSSLRTRAQAEREFERLKGNYPALLQETELVVREGSVSDRGTFFRVLTGRFDDAGAAQALCRSLRDRGQDCLVVRR